MNSLLIKEYVIAKRYVLLRDFTTENVQDIAKYLHMLRDRFYNPPVGTKEEKEKNEIFKYKVPVAPFSRESTLEDKLYQDKVEVLSHILDKEIRDKIDTHLEEELIEKAVRETIAKNEKLPKVSK